MALAVLTQDDFFSSIIAFITGCVLIFLGLFPTSAPCHGGATKPSNVLTAAMYSQPVAIAPFSDKWATGDLTDDYPVCPYVTKNGLAPPDVRYTWQDGETRDLEQLRRIERHWGQRKLLLSEIDFLSSVEPVAAVMVYAGAADGRHMPILADMFPLIEFHLYDPRPFYPGLASDRIRLNEYYGGKVNQNKLSTDSRTAAELKDQFGWFTDEVAAWYSPGVKRGGAADPRPVYFVSDIRTVPTEEEIERNQRQQESWIRIMRPHQSMLKYKVPYPEVGKSSTYNYIAGRVRLQCWAPVNSAETRLITVAPKGDAQFPDKKWDVAKWERNLAWYNTVVRPVDLSDRSLADFGVPATGTLREFWSRYVPQDTVLNWDFVYELQILAKALKPVTVDRLHGAVERVNRELITKGSHFRNYLKGHTSR